MKQSLNMHQKLQNPSPQTIAIVRALPGLGDLLCLVPALRALRSYFPDAQIMLVGLPWATQFVQRFQHYLDSWVEFPGYPGIPEASVHPQRVAAFLAQMQQLNLDLALQMHGNGICMNALTLLLGAQQSAGFFSDEHYCPDPTTFLAYPEQEHEIWRHLRLLEFLGIPLQGTQLEFPIGQSEWQDFQAIALSHDLRIGSYICIHPGASVSSRRWHPHNFAIVADRLAAQGWQIVLTGSKAEASLTQSVAQAMRFPAIDLVGKTSLGTIAALLKQSQLVVCNDTGISHLAAALRVKSVVVFSNSDPQRWSPLDRQRHRIVQVCPEECRQSDSEYLASDPTLFSSSRTTTAVITAAIKLLEQEVACAS
ncbi:glycosyltransferase family 9 protein [Pantanalinema rosaneae CENA516]|uniref:glycosyltransferase family 9 protein n=1 Tax=Pantanalinema rosaneae TaxID=1620701 RepID=UPI003D6DE637